MDQFLHTGVESAESDILMRPTRFVKNRKAGGAAGKS